uniref:Palmitoyltransferase n=1 Tax=Echinostoma caproni TaxID=27848 RepID=A0A183AWU0_9TREM
LNRTPTSFLNFSSPVNGWSVNYPLLQLVLSCPTFCFLMYKLFFWRHPTMAIRKCSLSTLVATELSRIRERVLLIQSGSDLPPAPVPTPFNDLYCVHCDVYLLQWQPILVKHCRLCDRCRPAVDHHCLFVMNCITRANLRYFFLLLLCSFCFMFSFCLLAIFLPMKICPLVYNQSDSIAWVSCLYERFPLSTILIPFHMIAGVWVLMLLNEQCAHIDKRPGHAGPRWKRRSLFGGLRFPSLRNNRFVLLISMPLYRFIFIVLSLSTYCC